jgi:predicted  nucleic acid-binding Zn-ribbon protein
MDIQTDMFKSLEACEVEALKIAVDVSIKRSDNVRRGLFARHNELEKVNNRQDDDIEALRKELRELKRYVAEMIPMELSVYG